MTPSEHDNVIRSEGADQGGDPACWLSRVCPDCGLFVEREPPARCPRCGAQVTAE